MGGFIPKWADLPNELVRQIFHHAARDSIPFCLQLALVSSWVHLIARSHLYHTVIITPTNLKKLVHPEEDMLRDSVPENLLTIRNCWFVYEGGTYRKGQESFHLMANLRRISLDVIGLIQLVKLPHISLHNDIEITLQSLVGYNVRGTGGRVLYNIILKQVVSASSAPMTVCTKITHIRLTEFNLIPISHFPRLTHLSIPVFDMTRSLVSLEAWALDLPSLKVFVVVIYEDLIDTGSDEPELNCGRAVENWVARHEGHRVEVRMWTTTSDAVQREWEEGWRGEPNIWGASSVVA